MLKLKYKVVNVCVQQTHYSEYVKDENLVKAFEEGWEYVTCNKIENWLQYILKKEVLE